MKNFNKNIRGFTLIELILAITIFVIIASGVAVPIIGNHLNSMENQKNVQANAVLTETWEAVRSIRNRSWANMTNQTHGLRNTSGYWEFYGRNDKNNGFTRSIIVKSAFRDGNGDLVQEGGTVDPDTKWVKVQISWEPTPYSVRMLEAESLLTNYVNPGVWPPE